ncbi:uncharacterized protein LOC100576425 isoform X2 [Apis mellifera]|uniref:Uncharacterized protein LOC100576425 isoform X2 n=1 Tax=Apis mellifera TaxID=7460 RepID=A0A7M7SS97_APIME|nr:uncharacterized protein LOC100576425 isoform X2 [Apis mellifera]|eukprot:XP_026301971.1 uncharacterized protein LOC100576425 isoform X2 [Apis mellifera]
MNGRSNGACDKISGYRTIPRKMSFSPRISAPGIVSKGRSIKTMGTVYKTLICSGQMASTQRIDRKIIRRFCRKQSGQMQSEIQASSNIEIIYLDLDCNITEAIINWNRANGEFHLDVENDGKNKGKKIRDIIKIAEKYNLTEQTQMNFSVYNTIHRIVIDIDGNVSNALLRIPMNTTVSRHGTIISWTSKGDAEGVRIETRNPPSGEWRLKLVGEDGSKYQLTVMGFVGENCDQMKNLSLESEMKENINEDAIKNYRINIKMKDGILENDKETFNNEATKINSEKIMVKQQNSNSSMNFKMMENKKITQERSLTYRMRDQKENNRSRKENFSDNDLSIISTTENMLINFVEYVTFVDVDKNVITTSNEKFLETKEEQENLHTRPSTGVIENLDVKRTPIQKNINISMRMIETLNNKEMSEELVNHVGKNIIEKKKMLIEVNRNSNLLVIPGTIHRIVFDVMNKCVLPVRYAFRVKSSPFRLYNIQPSYVWIYPGQMSNVAIDLIVPDNVAPDTANTVTLSISGTEIKEKSVYLYVQGSLSKLTDDIKPTIEYSFNDNCIGKLEKDRCYKSYWSVDVTIQDHDSGLKCVISSLNDIYPRTDFISGTRNPITFYYSATCCDKTVKITAIDLLNNYNTIIIDVTAWNNLSEAEIAAITTGALLALLLIVLIVILIIYCVRKRKSHDLPYTQRYGSRPPTQSERTNF